MATTAQSSKTIVEEYLAARSAGDKETMASYMTDDVEWHLPKSSSRPPLKGREAIDGLAGGVAGQLFDLSTMKRDVTRITAEGDVVVVEQTVTAKTKDGKDYVNDYVWIYELRDGKIARAIEHADTLNANTILGDLVAALAKK